jgi:hypothetical protein
MNEQQSSKIIDELIKKTSCNRAYKKLLFLALPKFFACLLAFDFPSENPRTQTRNFCYVKPYLASVTDNIEI